MCMIPGADCHSVCNTIPCRYLVDVYWMKQWKKFVGFDTGDRSQVGEDSANPGPVDNKSLLAGTNSVQTFVYRCLLYMCAYM